MDRIFRRHNKIPVFDFTGQKFCATPVAQPMTNRDVFKEARPMAINKPRIFSPMTKYRINSLRTAIP